MTDAPAATTHGRVIQRLCIFCAGLLGASAVAMAAVAAHGLGALQPVALAAVRSAVEMQGWHSLALLGAAAWLPRGGWLSRLAALGFIIGVLMFCGGVYGHELLDLPVAWLAPIGGSTLILAWLVLGLSALRR